MTEDITVRCPKCKVQDNVENFATNIYEDVIGDNLVTQYKDFICPNCDYPPKPSVIGFRDETFKVIKKRIRAEKRERRDDYDYYGD